MARLLFFVLAAMFCFAASLPLRSRSSESSWADLTLVISSEDHPAGVIYDREFDLPTGSSFVDVPVWAVDAALFAGAEMAFGLHAKRTFRNKN
jgi:hypothetical protein